MALITSRFKVQGNFTCLTTMYPCREKNRANEHGSMELNDIQISFLSYLYIYLDIYLCRLKKKIYLRNISVAMN